MAGAPGHRLGQIVGDALELSLEPILREFAEEHGLYLDKKGPRPTRPGQSKCTWVDGLNNSHDLDFVLERGGTSDKVGNPAAFIETAWRRYTKHSRAKAQEIQGAVLPLLAKYAQVKPLAGAVVAGHWTPGALDQLRSNGFALLHLPYDDIVNVFAGFGVDIDSTEYTADSHSQQQVEIWKSLSDVQREAVGAALRECAPEAYLAFGEELKKTILRAVERVTVLPLHGVRVECDSIGDAIHEVLTYRTPLECGPVDRFEIRIIYSNGDKIEAQFGSVADTADFLGSFVG